MFANDSRVLVIVDEGDPVAYMGYCGWWRTCYRCHVLLLFVIARIICPGPWDMNTNVPTPKAELAPPSWSQPLATAVSPSWHQLIHVVENPAF
jgi:hypothetical protein